LDGLSAGLHGNPATAARDKEMRDWLRNNGYEVIEISVVELDDSVAMQRHFRRLAGYLRRDDVRSSVTRDTDWFTRAVSAELTEPVLRLVKPSPSERYVRCVPLTTLQVAAGAFGEPQFLEEIESGDWIEVPGDSTLRPGMFVAKVVGHSMEPRIPDGAMCLFSAPVSGARSGRIVLAQLQDANDPETGFRFTVKRYQSEKQASADGEWRHVRVVLEPLNTEFAPIELNVDDEGAVQVVAEFLRVI